MSDPVRCKLIGNVLDVSIEVNPLTPGEYSALLASELRTHLEWLCGAYAKIHGYPYTIVSESGGGNPSRFWIEPAPNEEAEGEPDQGHIDSAAAAYWRRTDILPEECVVTWGPVGNAIGVRYERKADSCSK